MGHSTVGITLGTYSHVTEGLQDQAAVLIAGMMMTGVSKPLAATADEDHD